MFLFEVVVDDSGLHIAVEALHDSVSFVGGARRPSAEQGSFGEDEARETARFTDVF
jgi:hypothetical protein